MSVTTWRPENPEELKRQLLGLERRVETGEQYETIRRIFERASSPLKLNGQKLQNIASPADAVDAVNRAYLETLHGSGLSMVSEDFTDVYTSVPVSTTGQMIGRVSFQQTSGGTYSVTPTPVTEHPGYLRLTLPAVPGAVAGIIGDPHLSRGGDHQFWLFRTATTLTGITTHIGQFAGTLGAEPSNGIYLSQSPFTATFGFKSANAGVRTAGSTVTLAVNTWYGVQITWDVARTGASCTLYDELGTVLLTQILTTNLPTTAVTLFAQANATYVIGAALAQALDVDLLEWRHGAFSKLLKRARSVGGWS